MSLAFTLGRVAAEALLPPGVGSATGVGAAHVCEWQATTDGSELLYAQYKELFVLIEADCAAGPALYCPFIYVDQDIVPIRLTQIPTNRRVLPFAGVEVFIGRRLRIAGQPKQRPKRIERVESAVEAERELVQVRLKMLWTYTVMRPAQPVFQSRKDEMDDR